MPETDHCQNVKHALARKTTRVIGFADMQALMATAERLTGTDAVDYARQLKGTYSHKACPRVIAQKLVTLIEQARAAGISMASRPPLPDVKGIEEVDAAELDKLDLPDTVVKKLQKEGLETVGDVKDFGRTGNDLTAISGIGQKLAMTIKKSIAAFRIRVLPAETDEERLLEDAIDYENQPPVDDPAEDDEPADEPADVAAA